MRRPLPALVLVAALLAGCTDDGTAAPSTRPTTTTSAPTSTTSPTVAPDPVWAAVEADLAALGPAVGLLAAEVGDDGSCTPVHQVQAATPRPTGSQFKLWVLAAVTEAVAAGTIAWDDTLTVEDAVRSLGNGEGSLQLAPTGTTVTVEEAAAGMISISDNTATDMLIGLVGREAVEAQVARWTDRVAANTPLLTTRQMILLHYGAGLGERYLATPAEGRAAFLAAEVDPLPLDAVASGYSTDPRFVEEIEWFASPEDLCRSWAGLAALATTDAGAPLPAILSEQVAGIGLDRSTWPTVWYKGGSEPGVLTMGWLATDAAGRTVVVEAMVVDPVSPLAPDAITDLVALAEDVFAALATS